MPSKILANFCSLFSDAQTLQLLFDLQPLTLMSSFSAEAPLQTMHEAQANDSQVFLKSLVSAHSPQTWNDEHECWVSFDTFSVHSSQTLQIDTLTWELFVDFSASASSWQQVLLQITQNADDEHISGSDSVFSRKTLHVKQKLDSQQSEGFCSTRP